MSRIDIEDYFGKEKRNINPIKLPGRLSHFSLGTGVMMYQGDNTNNSMQTAASLLTSVDQTLDYSLLSEGSSAKFICHFCKKTFYNENALQNHKNMQHDIDDSSSTSSVNVEQKSINLKTSSNAMNVLGGFKFIPLFNCKVNDQITEDGLITRTMTEDTSYLLVKMDGDISDADGNKRLGGLTKKSQLRNLSQPVNLRGPFECTFSLTLRPDLQCRKIFYNCCEYSLHYREEHTKRRKAALRCQVCEKRLDRYIPVGHALIAQLPTPNPVSFFCRLCGQTFLDRVKYEKHNMIVHAKTKPHQCSICSKRFTQQGGLQQHMRMHTGIRPYACTFCPKTFTQKAGLDQHHRTHTKVKPFKCVICSKSFSQSVHLRQHMRTHTNIQPFECNVCGRRFKQRSHLNFHLRSHMSDAETGALVVERYAQVVREQEQMEFLSLSNLQPVQDGETMYYAAELAAGGPSQPNQFPFETQPAVSENILSL